MKKHFFILLLIICFIGCEKEFESTIDEKFSQFQIVSITQTEYHTFNIIDSSLVIYVGFDNIENIASVWADIYSPNYVKVNTSPIKLFDDGKNGDVTVNDKIFSNRFLFTRSYSSGNYTFEYFLKDKKEATTKIAVQRIFFNNGQSNVKPYITSYYLQDSVEVNIPFIFNVSVIDSNGLSDIKIVYFKLFRPDKSIVLNIGGGTDWQMFDDGNIAAHGDTTANDGKFSFANYFTSTSQKGYWRFEFEAIDRVGILSNKITDSLYLK
jgi:hypothetical protein